MTRHHDGHTESVKEREDESVLSPLVVEDKEAIVVGPTQGLLPIPAAEHTLEGIVAKPDVNHPLVASLMEEEDFVGRVTPSDHLLTALIDVVMDHPHHNARVTCHLIIQSLQCRQLAFDQLEAVAKPFFTEKRENLMRLPWQWGSLLERLPAFTKDVCVGVEKPPEMPIDEFVHCALLTAANLTQIFAHPIFLLRRHLPGRYR